MNLYARFKALTLGVKKYYATVTDKDAYQTVVTLIGGGQHQDADSHRVKHRR